MKSQLRVLHLEDSPEDAELLRAALDHEGLQCDLVLVKSRDTFETAVAKGGFDLILSDYSVPGYDGLSALRLARTLQPDVPFILVSGTLGEDHAVDSLKSGATDYVLKTRLSRLVPAVRRALSESEAQAQRRQTEEQLRQSQELFRQITENVDDLIAVLDLRGKRVFLSPSYQRVLGSPQSLVGTDSFAEIHPEDREHIRRIFDETVARGVGQRTEYRLMLEDQSIRLIESQGSVIRDREGAISGVLAVARDITERKGSEAALALAHKELLGTSRLAGMAEVATSVLHNVGNVLNSVNVSATLVAEKIRKSRSTSLAKVVAMLREHESDLGRFITSDARGKQIPAFLATLTEHLEGERAALLAEVGHLQRNLDHIKDVVAMHQNYAKVSGVTETLQVADLIEDALRMNADSLDERNVTVVREFELLPAITVDKHKVLQILVNLVRNAEHACETSGRNDKRLSVRLASDAGRVRISVSDNGVGISPKNLTRIFSHGCTTKQDGHGFGLHNGALAAMELGGSLSVHSDGPGQGATFILELPLSPPGP